MNKKAFLILLLTGLAGLSSTAVYAQKTDPDADKNLWMQQPVTVDGNSAEWQEPLNNFNMDTRLAFALANDQNNLYLIIESLDEMTTGKLFNGGLTLNINTAGKKKDGVKINFLGHMFPAGSHDAGPHESHDHGVNMVQVSGFKNIPDGQLTIPNQQGVQVAAAFDAQKDYVCELAIPLAQLDLKGDELKAIAYNIKINAGSKGTEHREGKGSSDGSGSGGGMHGGGHGGMSGGGGGGMGGGRHGGGGMGGRRGNAGAESSGSSAKSSDFWIKYELATPSASYRSN